MREGQTAALVQQEAEAYLARLHELLVRLRQLWRCEERAGQLSWPQRVILRCLHHHGPSHPHVLADYLGVSRSTLTGLVDGLEGRGLVRRIPGQEDRRTLLVALTDVGTQAAEALEQAGRRFLLQALMTLDPPEAEVLVRALEKLVQAWSRPDQGPRVCLGPQPDTGEMGERDAGRGG